MRETITSTFVLIAPDCPLTAAVVPVARGNKPTIPLIHYELLIEQPYRLTLEDLMFETYIRRAGIVEAEAQAGEAAIHADLLRKPHACMRASALPKTYGWGVHHDVSGRLALFAVESRTYRRFAGGEVTGVSIVAAMRSRRP